MGGWQARLPEHGGTPAQHVGLGGQRQAGYAGPAAERSESPAPVVETQPDLGQRLSLGAASCRMAGPCLILRVREGLHHPLRQISATGWPSAPYFRMNVFRASVNFDVLIGFHSSQPEILQRKTPVQNAPVSRGEAEQSQLVNGESRQQEFNFCLPCAYRIEIPLPKAVSVFCK
jgi:hypothetical protein